MYFTIDTVVYMAHYLGEVLKGVPMKQTLTPEQLASLQSWAQSHGRNWKQTLRDAWMTGNYDGFAQGDYLQQIRNVFGPSWLISFRLPVEIPIEPAPVPPVTGPHYDYTNQAWTVDGHYVRCGHPGTMDCKCYGKVHEGELAPIENLPTATESA